MGNVLHNLLCGTKNLTFVQGHILGRLASMTIGGPLIGDYYARPTATFLKSGEADSDYVVNSRLTVYVSFPSRSSSVILQLMISHVMT